MTEQTGPHQRPVEEGVWPPVAYDREIRTLLNSAWKQQQLHGGAQAKATLAIAELMYRAEQRACQEREGVPTIGMAGWAQMPAEVLDTYVRKQNQLAYDAGKEKGAREADVANVEKLAAIEHAALDHNRAHGFPRQVAEILPGDTNAAEYIVALAAEKETALGKLGKIAQLVDTAASTGHAATLLAIQGVLDS